ncbi:hypothetical protein Efla_004643 [Eimeria flavescens]
MQLLQESPGPSSQDCFLAVWGTVREKTRARTRLWLLCGDSRLQAFDFNGSEAAAVEVHIPVPPGHTIVMAAHCTHSTAEEASLIALGTQAGLLLLVERTPEQLRGSSFSVETWRVLAEAPQAHGGAPIDAGAWTPDARKRQGFVRYACCTANAGEPGGWHDCFALGGCGISSLCWDAYADFLLIACGDYLNVASMQGNHESMALDPDCGGTSKTGGVSSADWASSGSRLIASTGCDWRCCIWDSNGLLLLCMQTEHLRVRPHAWPLENKSQKTDVAGSRELPATGHPTAVAWSPAGDRLLLSVSGCLILCTSNAQVLDIQQLVEGTSELLNLLTRQWFSCSFCGGRLMDVKWQQHADPPQSNWRFCASLAEQRCVEVEDALNGTQRRLFVRDPVVDYALSEGKTQSITAHAQEFASTSSPFAIEASHPPQQLVLGCGVVCYVDELALHVLNLSGNSICSIPRPAKACCSIRAACSSDTVAIVAGKWMHKLQISDARTGKAVADYIHPCEIKQVEISLYTTGGRSLIAIQDAKGALLVAEAARPSAWHQIGGLVTCARWVWGTSILVGVVSGKLLQWLVVEGSESTSPSLQIPQVLNSKVARGKCEIVAAEAAGVQILHADGSVRRHLLPQLATQLLSELQKGNWQAALHRHGFTSNFVLCSIGDNESLWSGLARAALHSQNFEAAAVALAALNDLPRVQLAAKAAASSCPQRQKTLSLRISGNRKSLREAAAALRLCGQAEKAVKLCMKSNLWKEAVSMAEGTQIKEEEILNLRDQWLQLLSRPHERPLKEGSKNG